MRSPVFWLATSYAAGLALFAQVDDSPRVLWALSLASLLAGCLALGRGRRTTPFAFALLGFLLLGGATIRLQELEIPSRRIDRLLEAGRIDLSEAVRIRGWLRREPERKPFALFFELELESVETGGQPTPTSGGVRLAYYLPAPAPDEPDLPEFPPASGERTMPSLHYGDCIEALVRVHRPVRYQNPGSFDWRAHLARQEVFLEGSLKSPVLLETVPGRRGQAWLAWIQAVRVRLLERLDALVDPDHQPDENAVLRAMLLGDTSFLNHQVSERFRQSGTYHILVVSGLNVGLIAAVLFWLLRRLGADEWVTTGVTIPLLVFYLFLVEDRPPVERAVWMVSFYLFTRLLFRQVHLSNPTALAVLLVLFLHPQWLFDPSFHLSFGAVFLISFFALPWMERSSRPYRDATRFLDAEERDDRLGRPRLAQFRLDLRALAAGLGALPLRWRPGERGARWLLTGTVRLGLRAWDLFLLSLAVQLGFVLLAAVYFERVVWIGLLTNILVTPLVGVIVPLGMGVLAVAAVSTTLGAVPAYLLRELTAGLLALVEWFGRPGLSYPIPPPPFWVALLHLAALLLLARAAARGRHQRWAGLALAVFVGVILSYPFPPRRPNSLEMTVLDVGQGDAIFLAFPSGETWLVDGGPGPRPVEAGYRIGHDAGKTVVAPFLRSRGSKRIDHIWLSHAHHDHMGGLGAVLEEFEVGAFHVGRNPESRAYRGLLGELQARGIPLRRHQAGERLWVGDSEVQVLWPPADYEPGRTPSNNDSLVLRLCLPAAVPLCGTKAGRAVQCLLLAGDIEPKVERQLALGGENLRAEILKVPHHGGRGAASEEFLGLVEPAIAVLSVGAVNPFGHPRPDTLERLRAQGAKISRTDEAGAITLRLEGQSVSVHSYADSQVRGPYPNLPAYLAACLRRWRPLEFE